MRAWLAAATMACGLLGATGAGATVVFSLTGTVGDQNWNVSGSIADLVLDVSLFPDQTLNCCSPFGPYGKQQSQVDAYEIVFKSPVTIIGSEPGENSYFDAEEYLVLTDGTVLSEGGGDCFFCEKDVPHVNSGSTDTFFISGAATGSDLATEAQQGVAVSTVLNEPLGAHLDEMVDTSADGLPYSVTVFGLPEPATWAVMLVGFCGLGARLRLSRHPHLQPVLP